MVCPGAWGNGVGVLALPEITPGGARVGIMSGDRVPVMLVSKEGISHWGS